MCAYAPCRDVLLRYPFLDLATRLSASANPTTQKYAKRILTKLSGASR